MGHVSSSTLIFSLEVSSNRHDSIQDDHLGAKRIAFSNKQSSQGRFAVTSQLSPDITCNKDAKAPALIAQARAGSNLTFMWSPWLVSHKGPLITYMAPYEGDIEKVIYLVHSG
jgi:hypothetical protein